MMNAEQLIKCEWVTYIITYHFELLVIGDRAGWRALIRDATRTTTLATHASKWYLNIFAYMICSLGTSFCLDVFLTTRHTEDFLKIR